ncbi:unnamed protein product [Clonostachys byssicola]|uniref:Copper transport protein n=1 Tax=Clonostachys byssicola TaxID=160290 RepID=A0A9N9UKM1_9HYPO|nr:unnamed protein product [Clonostachys byssicola]
MDHGSSDSAECKTAMLWNWDTVDTCVFASSWQITSGGIMAASCIGVALLVVLLEVVRRASKEYDNFLLGQYQRRASYVFSIASSDGSEIKSSDSAPRTLVLRASLLQQLTRSVLYACTSGLTWALMLIVMSFNGYLIISMIIGAGLGKFLCDWFVVKITEGPSSRSGTTDAISNQQQSSSCCS